MKKQICAVLALALVLGLCACATKKEVAKTVQAEAEQPPVGLANPLQSITAEEMAFPVNLPEGATDAEYFMITAGDVTYEARFMLDGRELYVRVKSTAETAPFDFSGLYASFTEADAEVKGMPARTYVSDTFGVVAFVDVVPGIAYNVCSKNAITAEELVGLAEECYVPTQGNVG